MPIGILTLMNMIHFVLSWTEQDFVLIQGLISDTKYTYTRTHVQFDTAYT